MVVSLLASRCWRKIRVLCWYPPLLMSACPQVSAYKLHCSHCYLCVAWFHTWFGVHGIASSFMSCTFAQLFESLCGSFVSSSVVLPPLSAAEYAWEYSLDNTNFVPLSNQSSYTKDPVEASDRGYYRFSAVNIANQANPLQLNYTVTVPCELICLFGRIWLDEITAVVSKFPVSQTPCIHSLLLTNPL